MQRMLNSATLSALESDPNFTWKKKKSQWDNIQSSKINKIVSLREFVLRKAFKQLDKDGSGTLSKAEIEAASKKEAGLDIAAEKIADLLAALKQDKKWVL